MADGAKIARFHRTYMLHLLNDLKSRNYGAVARVVLLSKTSSTAIKSLVKFQKRYSIVLPQCLTHNRIIIKSHEHLTQLLNLTDHLTGDTRKIFVSNII